MRIFITWAAVAILLHVVVVSAIADTVSVATLPLDVVEVVGTTRQQAHILRIGVKNAGAPVWSDSNGNTFLAPITELQQPGVEVTDGATVHYPVGGLQAEIKTISPTQVDVVTHAADGFTLTYTVTPQRLGIRVDGSAPTYTLRLRCLTAVDGCRLHAGGKVTFLTAGMGAFDGDSQLIVDARRTRAMSVTPPAGTKISWGLDHLVRETDTLHLMGELAIKPGQTLWLSTESIPPYSGPVEMGFFGRYNMHPGGAPVAAATLSSAQLQPGSSSTLTFKQPIETTLKTGTVVAALIPTSPGDPVVDGEGPYYWSYPPDVVGPAMLPLEVTQNDTTAAIKVPAAMPSGAYHMRVWIVPHDQPLPEALGGPKGAMVAFFPGLIRGQYWPTQPYPAGDVFVGVQKTIKGNRGSLSVVEAGLRRNFWRGESIHLIVQAHAPDVAVTAPLTIHLARSDRALAIFPLKITLINGYGSAELALPTTELAPGEYRAEAAAEGLEPYAFSFTIAPPATSGMAFVNSTLSGPGSIKAFERLGLNVWTDVMPFTGGYTPGWANPTANARGWSGTNPAMPVVMPAGEDAIEQMVHGNWLWLQGIQSRQVDFFLHHSIPEHVDETLRKHLVYAQFNQRFPSMLGLVFGYDVIGVQGATSWGAGWETFGAAGVKRTAMLNARWQQYWKDAQAKGATAAEETRLHNLFNASVFEDMYGRSVKSLHDYLPEQRHTTSSTLDHATMADGLYAPSIYGPLDFRYIEVWNDQVYPCSAHDMQESFWASILRMEKPANEPLWVTIPVAAQPGTHLRRALNVIGRGATGVGYCAEGGDGLTGGVWGPDAMQSNIRTAEVNLSSDVVNHYGAFFNQFTPNEKIAILYSVSQGGWNFGMSSPIFYAYYTLAEMNRPAQLLTEKQIAGGDLSGLQALVIVRQSATLPPATLAAIEQFATSGGKVLCDRDTTLQVKGMQKLAGVAWPPGMWPCCTNEFHEMLDVMTDSATSRGLTAAERTISYFNPQSVPTAMPAALATALGDAGRQPLELVDGRALVLNKVSGASTLVLVSNENTDPLEGLFTDAQLKARFFRYFLQFGWVYYKDLRVPGPLTLRLRDDLAASPPHIYDVFAGRELRWQDDGKGGVTVTLDMATLLGRALLLTPKPIESPTVWVGQRRKSDPLATVVVRSDVPLPVRVRMGNQEIFRASSVAGSSDTFALGPLPGAANVEVTDLISGKTRRGQIELIAPTQIKLEELPAVQVRDPARVQRLLATKGLAIYVDPRQAEQLRAAQQLAAKLPPGAGAQMVFNPRVEDYVLDWDLPADVEAINARTRDQGLVGERRPIRAYFQWMGPLTPATVWNRPAIVFGNAGDNRLIADLNAGTLLERPATPEMIGNGHAIIGVAASPFWNNQDVVYALTADAVGTAAALEKLASLASEISLDNTATSGRDDSPLAERRRQLGFEPLRYPDHLIRLHTESIDAPKPRLAPCIPVAGLTVTNDGVLVALGTPGKNLVRLDAKGREQWRTMTAGFYQPVEMQTNATGESAVRDDSFVWRHDATGKPLWKMLGTLAAPIAADGSAWVVVDTSLKHVSPTGDILQTIPLPGKVLALTPDCRTAFVQKPGPGVGSFRIEASVVAVELSSSKQLWSVADCEVIEAHVSGDGKFLACVENDNVARRDDVAVSRNARLTVIDIATGCVKLRLSMGLAIAGLLISPDGNTVMARESTCSNLVFLANLTTGVIRQLRLPEVGGWAHAFSLDGKTLWIACEKLYRIDVDSLALHSLHTNRRVVQLVATSGGLVAGTADGRVLWLGGKGELQREVSLADGIGVKDMLAEMAPLRDARLVDSPSVQPHEVPDTINLRFEFPRCWSDVLDFRGDGIVPPHFALHVATAGKFRFTIPLYNAKTDAANIGVLKLVADDGTVGVCQAVGGDKLNQVAVMDLKPGNYDIHLVPEGWRIGVLLKDMKVEKAE